MRQSRVLMGIMAAAIAVSAVATTPSPVAAGGDQLQETGLSTYELQPSKHTIHVTTVFTLINKAPSKAKRFDCSYYAATWYGPVWVPATCTRRTNYYYNSYTFEIEQDATNIKVKTSSGSASIKRGKLDGSWRVAKVKMSPLWYGKTRKLTVSYDLPAGGPRSTALRKAGYAYADFCAFGPAGDKGQARIVVPSGYTLVGTAGMTSATANGKTTYTSPFMKSKPWSYSACVTGTNKNAATTTSFTTPGGRTIAVQAWKDDPTWAAAATTAVKDQLPKLEAIFGGTADPKPITVREERSSAAGGSPSLGPTNELVVGEDMLDPATVTDALTGAIWLPKDVFGGGWLRGAYAAWGGSKAGTSSLACTEPGAAPAGGIGDLTRWVPAGPASSDATKALWAWKQQAACSLLAKVETAAGNDATLAILDAIRAGERAWPVPDGAASPATTSGVPWQDWLDLVTERALVPAGADLALLDADLVQYGISTDANLLAERQKALAAYHALLTAKGSVPAFITEDMRTWDYAAASVAIATMHTAFDTVAKVETVLPDVETAGGPVEQAVTAAKTQADLDAAVALAEKQVALATDVASAFQVEAAPRDTLQDLGLAGTVPADHAPAVSAVQAVDDSAAGQAQQIRATITGAKDTGTQRAALIGGSILGVLLLAVLGIFLVRRRSSRVAVPAGASAAVAPVAPIASAPGTAPVAPVGGTAPIVPPVAPADSPEPPPPPAPPEAPQPPSA